MAPRAGASGATGAPSVSLTTSRAGSWVWGVGDDWDSATERTVGSGQTKVDEFLASAGDTFWVQRQTSTTPLSGTQVTLNDTAPTGDRWNLAAVEVLGAAQNPPPPAPTLTSTVPASPANQNAPKLLGSAAAGSQVSIYSTSDCTGDAARDRHRRRTGSGNHGHGARQLEHRPARHRDRVGQHLLLLGAAHLRRGLGRAADPDRRPPGGTQRQRRRLLRILRRRPGWLRRRLAAVPPRLDRSKRLGSVHLAQELQRPRRRSPPLRSAGDRPGREHRRLAGAL